MDVANALTQLGIAGAIVVAVIYLLREVKKLAGNGKLDALVATVDKLDEKLDAEAASRRASDEKLGEQIGDMKADVEYIKGRVDAGPLRRVGAGQ